MRQAHYDLVILGSGSTAFAAALRAQELGKTSVMTEERITGGTCVNRGCLPSKNLIEAAKIIHDARHPRYPGLAPADVRLNFRELITQTTFTFPSSRKVNSRRKPSRTSRRLSEERLALEPRSTRIRSSLNSGVNWLNFAKPTASPKQPLPNLRGKSWLGSTGRSRAYGSWPSRSTAKVMSSTAPPSRPWSSKWKSRCAGSTSASTDSWQPPRKKPRSTRFH
jgi:hypothetical protein